MFWVPTALRMYAARPDRSRIVDVICTTSGKCPSWPCVACVGKANVILRMIEGEENWVWEVLRSKL